MKGLVGYLTKDSFDREYEGRGRNIHAVLCASHVEKKRVAYDLEIALGKAKVPYCLWMYRAAFYNPWADTVVEVNFESVGSSHWKTFWRGTKIQEVVVTPRAKTMVEAEDVDRILDHIPFKDTAEDTVLYHLLKGYGVSPPLRRSPTGCMSMSPDFDFPWSLWTPDMSQYIEDTLNPTREEFLFALMMENISGNTETEREAIQAAQLHVEGQADKPSDD